MNMILRFAALVIGIALSGTQSFLLGHTPDAGIEQQVRSQYPITSVGNDGVVVRGGSVLAVQQDGILALPSPLEWPCNLYKESRIKQSTMCAINWSPSKDKTRLLQVGEKVYLTALQFKPTEVVFKLQTCAENTNEAPYKATLSFQFPKGIMESNSKEVLDTIVKILTPDASVPPPPPGPPPVMSLKLPATYVSAQNSADQIQLNADNSFALREGGQSFHGPFTVNGDTLEFYIIETNAKTTAKIKFNNLIDSSGQAWVLRAQSDGNPPAPGMALIQNEDVIKMAKAGFDDAIIITKIASSKCQFDTSTDALIHLKQAGVSVAVIKAMLGAGK